MQSMAHRAPQPPARPHQLALDDGDGEHHARDQPAADVALGAHGAQDHQRQAGEQAQEADEAGPRRVRQLDLRSRADQARSLSALLTHQKNVVYALQA